MCPTVATHTLFGTIDKFCDKGENFSVVCERILGFIINVKCHGAGRHVVVHYFSCSSCRFSLVTEGHCLSGIQK